MWKYLCVFLSNLPVISNIMHFIVDSLFAFIRSSSSLTHLNILQDQIFAIRLGMKILFEWLEKYVHFRPTTNHGGTYHD